MAKKTTAEKAAPAAKGGSAGNDFKLSKAGQRLNDAMAAVQDAREGGDARTKAEAEAEWMDAIQWFVYSLVKPFAPNNSHLREEYMQAGLVGAVEALRTWDRNLGAASTVVKHAVRREVLRQVRQSEFPTMSDHDFAMRGKILRVDREAENHDMARDSHEEVARSLGLPVGAVKRVREYHHPLSTDYTVGEEGDMTFGELISGDTDAVNLDVTPSHEREMLLKALTVVWHRDGGKDASILTKMNRALGLDGEPPSSYPEIRAMFGKTNTESIRLLVRKWSNMMLEEIRSNPGFYGLDPELDVSRATNNQPADPYEKKVEAALTAEARFLAGEDFAFDTPQGRVLLTMLEKAYEEELDALIAWHVDSIGDPPPDRVFCDHCGGPNSPKRARVRGCVFCRKVSEGRLFRIDVDNSLNAYQSSKPWKRLLARQLRTEVSREAREVEYAQLGLF